MSKKINAKVSIYVGIMMAGEFDRVMGERIAARYAAMDEAVINDEFIEQVNDVAAYYGEWTRVVVWDTWTGKPIVAFNNEKETVEVAFVEMGSKECRLIRHYPTQQAKVLQTLDNVSAIEGLKEALKEECGNDDLEVWNVAI